MPAVPMSDVSSSWTILIDLLAGGQALHHVRAERPLLHRRDELA